jgi:hypothetical protein
MVAYILRRSTSQRDIQSTYGEMGYGQTPRLCICMLTWGKYPSNTPVLRELVKRKHEYACVEDRQSNTVKQCYDRMSASEQGAAKGVLKELAIKGFVEICGKSERRVAALLGEDHIEGVVTKRSIKCGFPKEFEDLDWDIGLVPSSQTMRLAIFRFFNLYMISGVQINT